VQQIDATTLRNWQIDQRDFVLVDTLPATAYNKGHLPGAIHILSDSILDCAQALLPDTKKEVVVYCASVNCKRAGLSAVRLESLGYTRIVHFVGGKRDWIAAGFLLEISTAE
jgi:rhodanese-related sulfurtransferase